MAAGYVRPAGQLDFTTALSPYAGPWNDRLAAHLMRRAGFGATPDEVARYGAMSPHDAAEALIHFPDTSRLAPPPGVMAYPDPRRIAFKGMDDMQKRDAARARRKEAIGDILALQEWWLNRMLTTPAPLQEKMTFFLHGHFTTAAIQKGVWPNLVLAQNQLFRQNALGNLHDLTIAVSKDPAMLLYLDNAENNKSHPNENYSRELMELFTLGLGSYTEEDVRQSARAFTGWTIDRRTGEFTFNPRTHDDGTKTFLSRTGNFDGTDIVDIIYQQRACERFWAKSLLSAFVYNDPEPELVDEFANVISRNHFELAPSMSVLLRSNVFYSQRAYRALVKSPVEFVVGAHKSLDLATIVEGTPQALRAMGQILFYPPNVAGWPGGANWLTSQMLIARENFIARIVNAQTATQSSWLAAVPLDAKRASREFIAAILQNDAPSQAYVQLIAYLDGAGTSALGALSVENYDERARGAAYLTMAMPAYQLG
ncbi:MAG TPA: DUF1800 domain-containing protein [Candidatus Baltobacteraceae bacterium]|nr:DUF1800 domain-containing protein [Candidatus Baltobacteraceae bacterium]